MISQQKLNLETKTKLEEKLYVFREERVTVDLIFYIRQLIEKSWKFNKDLSIAFIDYEKAFHRINQHKIWEC